MTEEGGQSTSQSMSADSVDDERPLKKARYIWHIKGRYGYTRPPRGRSNQSQQMAPVDPGPQLLQPECPISRWQTRQMARAVVDNTINSVLEEMGFTPPPDNEETYSFDVYPTIHNREGIENEAVLMAIQSHGLQKPSCICPNALSAAIHARTAPIPFHHRPSTPLPPPPDPVPSTSATQEKYTGETDFMAQAVAVAIQKKGLGSYSQTDHG